ncbi:hypothetical protein [Streptomyces sp. NBC_01180]|uniref:hypothetical protein n=1 Tax=Streptomyces sp. NBC_01180 TaxID=2903763 RepID=UPI00386CB07B|nr:hypothetical protein OG708_33595 [Streptomyces sp. NBC_01180]
MLFAAGLTQRLHTVVGRDVAPFEQAVVSVPGIVAPSTAGLRAPRAVVTVNIRTFEEHVREAVLSRVGALVRAETAAAGLSFGGDVRLTHDTHVPRVENAPAAPRPPRRPARAPAVGASPHRPARAGL